ncbi:MAG TPA: tRNA (guanosine(37)-N1)-methyltransferase TrmD [Candidatus Binatia bacterium]|nr:tRNA (guanosine(37)-N1)-methyltransferase TrmD [Candidatus Binatia bacterium]
MKIEVLTLFPEFVEQVGKYGIVRRAVEAGKLSLATRDIRDTSENRWRRVDERPYGGGPGMVMNPGPVAAAVEAAKAALGGAKVIALSPQGEPLTQAWARRLAAEPALVLVCGRYEGMDERVSARVDVELSLGDFVLSGGELAAMAVVDAVARCLPGVLGDEQSAENDSFSAGLLDHPHYTRPEQWRGQAVPEVLLSGDHAAVRRWRLKRALGATWLKRPDLLNRLELDEEQERLLREFIAEQDTTKDGRT